MDITNFVTSRRDTALQIGNYNSYRAQLSKRLLTLRRKLCRTSAKGHKYAAKSPITADEIASNVEFVHLLLLSAERAWAHAMLMKTTGAASDNRSGVTGSTRRHVVSRLRKASTYAQSLVDLLAEREGQNTGDTDILEAQAYLSSLVGAAAFEKQDWKQSLTAYSEVRVIYDFLHSWMKNEVFRENLNNTIDPSIRFAAYQIKIPRSRPVPSLAREYFNKDNRLVVSNLERLDPTVLSEASRKEESTSVDGVQRLAKTVTWRSRTVDLEDAVIAQALASVEASSTELAAYLTSPSNQGLSRKEKSAAYDELLIRCQDAVDAVRQSLDELATEGVASSDSRVQSLQIVRTAFSYDLISWRIGRNRVLVGDQDGATGIGRERKRLRTSEEGTGKKLSGFREQTVLYNATLQSLESIQDLPGVAADSRLMKELEAKRNYFHAQKCLAVARSHALLSNRKNALALVVRASRLVSSALSSGVLTPSEKQASLRPHNIDVSDEDARFLDNLLQGEVSRLRALVELEEMKQGQNGAKNQTTAPLVRNLHAFPSASNADISASVDLSNLVPYPVDKLESVPVKPIFLDVAWNYLEYPGRAHGIVKNKPSSQAKSNDAPSTAKEEQPQKRGWFSFGR